MSSQRKILSSFIIREHFERFKLQKRLILCLVKEFGYYCSWQGLWLGEVDIKEPLSGARFVPVHEPKGETIRGYPM